MANICNFEMRAKGTAENLKAFFDALQQEGNVWIGRGAELYEEPEIQKTEEEQTVTVFGLCKWSLWAALLYDAQSMKLQKEAGQGTWTGSDEFYRTHDFLTVMEATEKWALTVEAVSEECGCCFSEHYIWSHGKTLLDLSADFEEFFSDDDEISDYLDGSESDEDRAKKVLQLAKDHGFRPDQVYDDGDIIRLGGITTTPFAILED